MRFGEWNHGRALSSYLLVDLFGLRAGEAIDALHEVPRVCRPAVADPIHDPELLRSQILELIDHYGAKVIPIKVSYISQATCHRRHRRGAYSDGRRGSRIWAEHALGRYDTLA